jgi:hypothetical protein
MEDPQEQRLSQWCGDDSEDQQFWGDRSTILPHPGKKVAKLGWREFCALYAHYRHWWKWKREKWDRLWSNMADEERTLMMESVPYHIPLEGEEWNKWCGKYREVLIGGDSAGRNYVIDAFAFWVYYYKGKGRIWRWWAELTLAAPWVAIGEQIEEILGRIVSSKGQAHLLSLLSWSLVLFLFLFPIVFITALGGKQLLEGITWPLAGNVLPRLWKWVSAAGNWRYLAIALACGLFWFSFIEHDMIPRDTPVRFGHIVRRALYSIPACALVLTLSISPDILAGLAWYFSMTLCCGTMVYFLLLAAFPDVDWLNQLIPEMWLRFLCLVVPFITMLTVNVSSTAISGILAGWLNLLVVTFLILRLWWKALDRFEEARKRSENDAEDSKAKNPGESEKGSKKTRFLERLWEAILGFYHPYPRYPEGIIPTLLLFFFTLLAHVFWFRLQIAPMVRPVCDDRDKGISVGIVTPPWMSMEDQGELIINVANTGSLTNTTPISSPFVLTVALTVPDVEGIPGAELAYLANDEEKGLNGQISVEVPPGTQVSKSIKLTTMSLHKELWPDNLLLQVYVAGNGISQTKTLSIDIISHFIPAVYASSRTLLGTVLRLAWAIAQFSAMVWFASRGGKQDVQSKS